MATNEKRDENKNNQVKNGKKEDKTMDLVIFPLNSLKKTWNIRKI